MINFHVSSTPAQGAAKKTYQFLKNHLQDGNKVLLLLAGGSANQVYDEISNLVEDNLPWQNLTIAPGDERFSKNPIDKNVNWTTLQKSLLITKLLKLHVRISPVITGESFKSETEKFDNNLEQFVMNNYKIISIQGIGEDGHTAGIFPNVSGVFHKAFLGKDFAVKHEFGTKVAKRITISNAFIKELDQIIIFVSGRKKISILKEIKNSSKDYPLEEWFSKVNQLPALLLVQAQSDLYTDLNI